MLQEPLQPPSSFHGGGLAPAQQTVAVNDQLSARIPVEPSTPPHNLPTHKRTKTLDMACAPDLADSIRGIVQLELASPSSTLSCRLSAGLK